jgi:hypothetical protein
MLYSLTHRILDAPSLTTEEEGREISWVQSSARTRTSEWQQYLTIQVS